MPWRAVSGARRAIVVSQMAILVSQIIGFRCATLMPGHNLPIGVG